VATSGSYDFSVTRDDLIKEAYEELGVLEEGETPDADMTVSAARKLNMLVKTWAKKHNLHLLQDVVLFLVAGRQSYLLGNSSSDAEWCTIDDYNQMELAAAALSGATAITVDDATDFTNADRVGVVQDDGTIRWTTATKVGNVLTLASALTDDAAEGNVVFSYTSRVVRPLRLVRDSVYMRDISGNDSPVDLVAKTDYDLITGKTQSGKIIKVAYQPFLGSGRLWVWQPHDLTTDTLRFTIERPVQDFDATTDNPDFPVEWAKALYLNLAVMLAGPNGAADEIPRLTRPDGSGLADIALQEALDGDVENASVRFMPDMRR
jgi:hypothetical protein